MIIVGENINSTRKKITPLVEQKDKTGIQEIAHNQEAAGANYIDVNAGVFVDREEELLCWLVETVQEIVKVPLSIDSPNPKAAGAALERCQQKPLVNSISAEEKRYQGHIPLLQKHQCPVIALSIDDRGMPDSVEWRVDVAGKLITRLTGDGVAEENIYVDPLVVPISTESQAGQIVMATLRQIKSSFPKVKTICGLLMYPMDYLYAN